MCINKSSLAARGAKGLLEAELSEVYAATSKGYARGRIRKSEQG